MSTSAEGGVSVAPPARDLIAEFTTFHWTKHNIGHHRRAQQLPQLRRFERWLEGKPFAEVQARDFDRYMVWMIEQGNAPSSVVTYSKMIRPFFEWLRGEGIITAERLLDLRGVKAPRAPKDVPRPYKRPEIMAFWDLLDAKFPRSSPHAIKLLMSGNSSFRRHWRHHQQVQITLIIYLALYCGMRRHEIFKLSLDDIHTDNEYIPVWGKADSTTGERKFREVPYPSVVRDAATEWLALRRRLRVPHRSVWLRARGSRYREAMPESIFNQTAAQFGYEMHRFRHTCGTALLRAGMPLHQLKSLLGHSNYEQTLAYAQVAGIDLVKTMTTIEPEFIEEVGRRTRRKQG